MNGDVTPRVYIAQTTESMKSRMKMERELDKVQALMQGLSQQGTHLQQTIDAMRKSQPDLSGNATAPVEG